MGKVPEIGSVYVTTAQRVVAPTGTAGGITFSATAVPTPAAQSPD